VSEQEQETVIFVLSEMEDWTEERAAEWVSDVQQVHSTIDYETAVRPLKLTGGQICLRAEHLGLASDSWAAWQPDGLHYRVNRRIEYVGPTAVYYLKGDLPDSRFSLRPVMRKDTPFSEDSHD
jgi:hypothetical protein